MAFTVELPDSLYWIVSLVLENCSKGILTRTYEPVKIRLVKVISAVISVFVSAVVTERTTVPAQSAGVRV
jgi:hypothetical protein